MFDIGYSELLLIAIVALVVIGPKDLPRVMRTVGQWVGKARAMSRHVRSGFDTMMREAELEDMQRQWSQQNADIMRAHPASDDWMSPATGSPQAEAPVVEAAPPVVEVAPLPLPAEPKAKKPRAPRVPRAPRAPRQPKADANTGEA